jgi:hypothetical protein
MPSHPPEIHEGDKTSQAVSRGLEARRVGVARRAGAVTSPLAKIRRATHVRCIGDGLRAVDAPKPAVFSGWRLASFRVTGDGHARFSEANTDSQRAYS